MSDPKRLLTNDDAGALEKEMLSSWRTEGPSNEARAKTIAALGLGAGLAASGAAATGSIAPKAMTGAGLIAKWLTAALVVGAASTAVVVARTRSPAEAAPLAPSATAPAVAPSATPVPIVGTPDVPAVEASSPPLVVSTTAPTTASHPSHKTATTDLGPQIALMDRARASLAAGENARALDLARRYRASYPAGAFVEDADFVEVQALAKKGDDDGAKAAARRFLSAYPSSIHAAQVRAAAGF